MKISNVGLAIFTVLGFCLLLAGMALSQQPDVRGSISIPLPVRDQITIEDLQTQIANCTINASAESKYEAKLIARIHELEKQVADLKPAAPKAPPLESKPK